VQLVSVFLTVRIVVGLSPHAPLKDRCPVSTEVRDADGRLLRLTLASDDKYNQTSLAGVDLYDNLWERIRTIRNLNRHPYEFYQKLGYMITGVIPDAGGRGKPDIHMAKRII